LVRKEPIAVRCGSVKSKHDICRRFKGNERRKPTTKHPVMIGPLKPFSWAETEPTYGKFYTKKRDATGKALRRVQTWTPLAPVRDDNGLRHEQNWFGVPYRLPIL
jgi:hypothetical protein